MNLPAQLDHPSFATAVGTIAGYLLILSVMTTLIFLVPYALFFLL
ncbi:hypothetical protein ACFQJ7_00280 [Halovenus rubra]|uniref:Uncharacterized protein n=2 Tax=Halovenus rubra TaxID=869890 RepID=A0ACC7E245_9EURY|nr:hypothetical protein [Halovenus rubra]